MKPKHSIWVAARPKLLLAALAAAIAGGVALAPSGFDDDRARGLTAAAAQRQVPTTLLAAIERSRYAIRPQAAGGAGHTVYGASNPGQGMAARFTADGLTLTPALDEGQTWSLGLKLTGYGAGSGPLSLPQPTLKSEGNRIELQRGVLTEWFVNESRGLEHGFTLLSPPTRKDTGETLGLRVAVLGGLRAVGEPSGQRISFLDASGARVLSYGKLVVTDATGRRLPARMDAKTAELRYSVNASGAVYPLVIDPILASEVRLDASDGAPVDQFGIGVAISGDTALIGAPLDDTNKVDSGSAYVFVRNGGSWSEQQKLVASDGGKGDQFGFAVALDGDTALISAPKDNLPPGGDAGSAYVFVRSGTTWSLEQKLTAADAGQGDRLGSSVALDGNTALLGAALDDEAGKGNAGSAYAFLRTGTTWSQQQKLLAGDMGAADFFGYSVALSGNTAVVGAPRDNIGGGMADVGSVYAFTRSGSVWSEQQKLLASDGAPSDLFGISVTLDGDTALAGALQADTVGGDDAGASYAFVRSGSVWSEEQKLLAADGLTRDLFGVSVALRADTAVIGAYGDDGGAGTDLGSAYVFTRAGTVWSEDDKLTASDGAADDLFGFSVALDAVTALVGSPSHDPAAGSNAGSVYVYEFVDTVPPDTTIDSGPPDPTNSTTATFTFSGTDDVSPPGALDFECKLDGGSFAACTSPKQYPGLAAGNHTVQVRATDEASNTDPTPASYTWTIDTTAPQTSIDSGPPDPTTSTTATFTFSGTDNLTPPAALDFECKLDGGSFAACTSPKEYTSLSVGDHTFQVRAIDEATNVDATPATHEWTIEEDAAGCNLTGTTLTVPMPAGSTVTIARSGSAINVTGAGACTGSPTVNNVDTVNVTGTIDTELLQLDLSGGQFAPGATVEGTGTSEIEFAIDLAAGSDTLVVLGGGGVDVLKLGASGVNLNNDDDADLTLAGIQVTTVSGGGDSDTISGAGGSGTGSAYPTSLTLNGDAGNDTLTGGVAADVENGGIGNDTFKESAAADGGDVFNGGTGTSDTVSYSSRTAGVTVTIDGVANDGTTGGGEGDNVMTDVEKVAGSNVNDSLTAAVTAANTLTGNQGNDTLNVQDGVSGNDVADAGQGTDTCVADASDTKIGCEA